MKEFLTNITNQLQEIKDSGLYKDERIITTAQSAHINTNKYNDLLNFCANNYLGLSNSKIAIDAAHEALDKWGFGLSSVRFICGTLQIHKQLEQKISEFLGFEDAILFSSCYDANGGVFETLLTKEDAIISDSLNHASIIDGIRLCKAARYRYKNIDMADLEAKLQEADKNNARYKLIVSDGVFSMDGLIAPLDKICDLAQKYNALVLVDDSHATGVIGKSGKGSHQYCNVMNRVDIMTGTLGKALGGASGGYIVAKKQIIDILRQKARPNLFSNALAPSIVASTISCIEYLENNPNLLQRLKDNTTRFREGIEKVGLEIIKGSHPIVPIMLKDAKLAVTFSSELLKLGIYVIAFSYPVVPKEQARIRVQISAAHSTDDIDRTINAFATVKQLLNI